MHHIVSDGWSMGMLVGELATLYDGVRQARAAGTCPRCRSSTPLRGRQRGWLDLTPRHPLSTTQNSRQAAGTQGEAARQAAAGLLAASSWPASPPLLELPTDRPRPAVQTS